MFWKRKLRHESTEHSVLDASTVVSKVGQIYARFNEQSQLIKPRSSLPCSWFVARESFLSAYKKEYRTLPKELHHSYHLVYAEIAFFVDDELCTNFELSLSVAAKYRSERMQTLGMPENETSCRKFIASSAVKIQNREEIWNQLAKEKSCPSNNLVLVAETLIFCSSLYRAMYDEWVEHSNLLAYQNKN